MEYSAVHDKLIISQEDLEVLLGLCSRHKCREHTRFRLIKQVTTNLLISRFFKLTNYATK